MTALIGSDDGLALNRRQAIIWTNVDMFYWCIYAPLGLNEIYKGLVMWEAFQSHDVIMDVHDRRS